MAVTAHETFERGTDGTAISTSNTTFSLITSGEFDNVNPHDGTLCLLAGDVYTEARWGVLPAAATLHMTAYINVVNEGTSGLAYFLDMSYTGGNIADVRRNSDGTITIRDNITATDTSTLTVAENEWFRVDWVVNVTAGTQSLDIFTGSNIEGSTPDETISGTVPTGNNIGRCGVNCPLPSTGRQILIDRIAYGDDVIGSRLDSTMAVPNYIGTSGDYTTIAAWIAAQAALDGSPYYGVLIDNKNYNEEVNLTSGTDNATIDTYMWLDVASSVRHDGTAGSGARIVRNTAPTLSAVVRMGTDYSRLSGLEVKLETGVSASNEAIRLDPAAGGTQDGMLVEDCLIWTDAGHSDGDGIYAGNDNTEVTVVNSIFQGWDRGHIHMQNAGSDRSYVVNAYHCAFIDGMTDTENGGPFVADMPNTLGLGQTWNVYNCVATEDPVNGEVFVWSNESGPITWNGSNNLVGKTTAQTGTNVTDNMTGNILMAYTTGAPVGSGNNWIVKDPIASGWRDLTTVFRADAGNGITGAAANQQGNPTDTRVDLSVDILGGTRPTVSPDIGPYHNPTVTMEQASIRSSTTTGTTGDTTSLAVNLPGTINSGDLLLIAITTHDGTTISTPAGWTSIENPIISAQQTTHLVGLVADGTETGTETFSWTNSTGAYAWAAAIQDWDGTITNLLSGTDTDTNTNAITIPTSFTNPSNSSYLLGFVGYDTADVADVTDIFHGWNLIEQGNSTGSISSNTPGLSIIDTGAFATSTTRTDVEIDFDQFVDSASVFLLIPKSSNAPPNKPTITDPTAGSTEASPVSITITYSDPNSDPLAKVSIRREAFI